jgi:hypothetical protein
MPSMMETLREAAAAEERRERLVVEYRFVSPDRGHARSLDGPPERVTVTPQSAHRRRALPPPCVGSLALARGGRSAPPTGCRIAGSPKPSRM